MSEEITPNIIQQIKNWIDAEFSPQTSEIESPIDPLGVWHLDIECGEKTMVMEWHAIDRKIGILNSTGREILFGEQADVYFDEDDPEIRNTITKILTG